MRRVVVLIAAAALVAGCAESNLLRGAATDTTPPTLISSEPAEGAQNVGEVRVSLTFSEPMSTHSVQIEANPGLTWGAGTWSNGDRTLTFIPTDVRPNARYTLRISGRDRAGNTMAPRTLTFATGAVVQAGALVENLMRNRVFAAADERLYAVFLTSVAAAGERVLQAMPEDHRQLRETLAREAPDAVRKIREFFAGRNVTARALAEYALWLTPELQVGPSPTPIRVGTGPQGAQVTPTPTPAAPTPPAATPAGGRPVTAQLSGLDALVRDLYTGARGRELWSRAREDHEREAQQYSAASEERLRQAAMYLRVNALPFERFVIVPNLLGARDSVEDVRVGGTLHVVVGPSAGPNVRGVLRSFVRAITSPVVGAHGDLLDRSRALYDVVKDEAEARGMTSWEDVVRESLVMAVEARLALPNAEEQTQYVDTVFAQGHVLVRHFVGRLPALERGEVNLGRFVQEALGAVNVEQVRQQWANRRR